MTEPSLREAEKRIPGIGERKIPINDYERLLVLVPDKEAREIVAGLISLEITDKLREEHPEKAQHLQSLVQNLQETSATEWEEIKHVSFEVYHKNTPAQEPKAE